MRTNCCKFQKGKENFANRKERQSAKKNKFVNISSQEGVAKDSVLLEGRRDCNCQATKHDLINNCLSCGKIVCKQEGIEYIMNLKSIMFYIS